MNNNFFWYVNSAMAESIKAGEPLIDESLDLILDSAIAFAARNTEDDLEGATIAGERRFNDPTNPLND